MCLRVVIFFKKHKKNKTAPLVAEAALPVKYG